MSPGECIPASFTTESLFATALDQTVSKSSPVPGCGECITCLALMQVNLGRSRTCNAGCDHDCWKWESYNDGGRKCHPNRFQTIPRHQEYWAYVPLLWDNNFRTVDWVIVEVWSASPTGTPLGRTCIRRSSELNIFVILFLKFILCGLGLSGHHSRFAFCF